MRASALLCCAAAAALTLAGCSSRPVQAPVIERAPPAVARPAAPPVAETRPESYTVKRGDTLFSIALDQGHDYKELAAWNNLDNPNRIRPGQQLRLQPPAGVQESPVTVSPVTSSGRVETRPLGAQGAPRAEPAARTPGTQDPIKSEPLARKLPYSPENVALLQRGETSPKPAAGPVPAPAPAAEPVPAPAGKTDADIDDEDKVEWGWPVRGKILAGFSEASNKGLDIAGKLGDPVIAAAPGRVVYSGSGLRGYGKLVIIKHNKTYLSAYAHNRDILVKEGQSVVKGQKIAEIGNTDADAPKLHFEIRKLGKPVDPARFLPPS
ncbi:MAG TPA: peptidoglycan DD-metalloendopeptidase family protein [Burkholderiales bacterium]